MSKFQVTIIALFIIFIIIGVALFATYKGNNSNNELPIITVWGTFPSDIFEQNLSKINSNRSNPLKINYLEIKENNFDKTFIDSLARGKGPDAVLIPQDMIYKYEDKIVQIPYTTLNERDYKNTFIQQSELYLTNNGILALPFVIDPLIMYWNRDSFTNAGISNYPKYWDEFNYINSKITIKDVNSNIRKSAIAMGEFNNIIHAREILATLLLQSGNPITFRDSSNNYSLSSFLGGRGVDGLKTSIPAIDFYTQFSNPSNPNYSWNRSLTNSRSSFLSGNLAVYFGFASEINDLRAKNPNINFDIAPLPQPRKANNRVSFGTMYGFSIVRTTSDAMATYNTLSTLLSKDSLNEIMKLTYLPPIRRDMIAGGNIDPYLTIFYDSALISRGWLDINRTDSNKLFQSIVESITSGKKDSSQALQDGSDEYDILLKNI